LKDLGLEEKQIKDLDKILKIKDLKKIKIESSGFEEIKEGAEPGTRQYLAKPCTEWYRGRSWS